MYGDPDDRGAMVDDLESTETQRGSRFNLAAFIPGGAAPGPQELAVAGIILGALAFVVLVRRGFRPVLSK